MPHLLYQANTLNHTTSPSCHSNPPAHALTPCARHSPQLRPSRRADDGPYLLPRVSLPEVWQESAVRSDPQSLDRGTLLPYGPASAPYCDTCPQLGPRISRPLQETISGCQKFCCRHHRQVLQQGLELQRVREHLPPVAFQEKELCREHV